MLPFVALVCGIAAPAFAQSAADRWGLTDRHWQTSTDMELVRASEMALRCAEVKAIDESKSDVRSRLILALALRHGVCLAKDAARLDRIVASAAATGDPRAMMDLAIARGSKGMSVPEAKEVLALVQRAADLGDTRAIATLGAVRADGIPGIVNKDLDRGMALLAQSVRAGFWPAALMMDFSQQSPDAPWSSAEQMAALKLGAENQNYSAMAALALHLEKGDLGPADPAGAAQLRARIAARGPNMTNDDELADALSWASIEWKPKETPAQRITRLQAEANAGDAEALYQLGQVYEFPGDATHIKEDKAKSLSYFVAAARKGHDLAPYGAITYLWDKQSPLFDEATGIALFREAAKKSDEAKRRLANYLAYDSVKFRSPKEAVRLYREGIAAGDPYALSELAALLEGPASEDPVWAAVADTTEALALYKRYLATDAGKTDGNTMAAFASLVRQAGEGDPVTALEWARRAVALDSPRGNMVMGDFHFYGYADQPVSYAKARQHWVKAAELDSRYDMTDRIAMADSALNEDRQTRTAAQMAELGMKYETGVERPYDPQKAKSWLLRAVAAGTTNRDAIFRLAELQENDGQYREAAATYGRLATGRDATAAYAREAIGRMQSSGKIARPAAAAAPAPRAVAAARPAPVAAAAPRPPAPAAPKPSGNARVPIGKPLICEMKSWSGFPKIGLYSRDKQTRYDDAFRIEFLSRTQMRITGSEKLRNGVRNIAVQGSQAIVSDPYPQTNGMMGITFRNISPFTFNLGSWTFREVWTSSMGNNTIHEGNCE
ncbi:MAG: hypothetical protein ACKOPQ_12180 [Novosphingobium sp.]